MRQFSLGFRLAPSWFWGLAVCCLQVLEVQAQLSGDIQVIANFFVRDSAIGAANTPQYDRQKFGSTSWTTLNYRQNGFDLGVRFDAFLNSNLVDPQDSYTAAGIGRWHLSKKIDDLDISVGYLYDQIGNGTIFRAFEARLLAIDNALLGARLAYQLNTNWRIKVMAGQQKKVEKQPNLLETYQPVIVAGALDGSIQVGEHLSLVLGTGVLRRTLDDASMNRIASDISSYVPADKFIPKYTTYVGTAYNNLIYKDLSWYTELSYKTAEAVNTLRADGVLESKDGYNIYSSLGYTWKSLNVMGQFKRTNHFILRTSPLQTLTRGQIAFLPPMARQNTYRLTARYNAATQEIGEQSIQLDAIYSVSRKLSFLFNYSDVKDLQNRRLYKEFYGEITYKPSKKWKWIGGFQHQTYNQEVYEFKPGVPLVRTYTPFVELNYKLSKTTSLRFETSYMYNLQDFGSWAWVLVELNMAPHWSISVSDMINTLPTQYSRVEHFYTALVNYSKGSQLFSLGYVKQVEGVVCTGGICRYEPAFNGVRFQAQTRF